MKRVLFLVFAALLVIPNGCNLGEPAGGGTEGKGLTGVLTDRQGRPTVGALVRAYPFVDTTATLLKKGGQSSAFDSIALDSAVTDRHGRYSLVRLPNGRYNIDAVQWIAGKFLGIFTPAVTYEGGRKEVARDSLRTPGSLSYPVRWEGLPVPGARCRIPGSPYAAISDAGGTCGLVHIPPGTFRVHVSHTDFLSVLSRAAVVVSGLPTRGDTVQLGDSLNLPGISGRLRNSRGAPVAGALVIAYRAGVGDVEAVPVDSAITDAWGRFHMGDLEPGTYNLESRAWEDGREIGLFVPNVRLEGSLYRKTDTLRVPGAISLRVHSQGFPIAGVHCYLPATSFNVFSDESGYCLLRSVPAGRYKVQVRDTRYLPAESDSLVVISDSTTNAGSVDLSEPQATSGLQGTVRDSSGGVAPGALVRAYTENSAITPARDSALTDLRGRYRLGNLPPGTYRIEFLLWKNGTFIAARTNPLLFLGDMERGADTLRAPGGLRLRLVSAGQSLSGVECRIPASPHMVFSNDSGTCTFSNLPAGKLQIRTSHPGHLDAATDSVTILSGAFVDAGTLALVEREPEGGLRGLYVDTTGARAPGVLVRAFFTGDSTTQAIDSALTDSYGRYRLGGLSSGVYNLEGVVWRNGGFMAARRRGVSFTGDLGLSADTLRQVGRVELKLLSENYAVANARCYVTGSSFAALSNDSGICVLENLPPGKVQVQVRHSAYLPTASDSLSVTSGKSQGGILQLAEAFSLDGLKGTLFDTEGVLSGARVRAYRTIDSGGTAIDSAIADTRGRYRFANLSSGTYDIEALGWRNGNYVTSFISGINFSGNLDRGRDTLRTPGALRVRLESQGKGVTGAQCRLRVGSYAAVSGDSGKCDLTLLPAGTFRVQVRHSNFAPTPPLNISIISGQTTDMGTIDLGLPLDYVPPVVGFNGTFVDSTGKPIAGLLARAFTPTDSIAVDSATTDVNGKYRLANLPTGIWQIFAARIQTDTLYAVVPRIVYAGGGVSRPADTVRVPGKLTLGIRSGGLPLAGATCYVPGTSLKVASDVVGNCNLTLPAGRFPVRVTAVNHLTALSDSITVLSGKTTNAGSLSLQSTLPPPTVRYFDSTSTTVALWTFNTQTNNRFADAGPNQFGLTAENATLESSGYGSALIANGTTTLLSIPHDALLTPASTGRMTWEARLRMDVLPSGTPATLMGMVGGVKIQVDPSGALRAVLTRTNTRGVFRREYITAPGVLPTGQWKDVAISVDLNTSPQQVYAFVDGQPVPMYGQTGTGTFLAYSSDKFTIGSDETKTEGFTGRIEEIRISNNLVHGISTALQAPVSEAGRHFAITPSTVALWTFNDGAHQNVSDAGPKGFDLTSTSTLPLTSSPHGRALTLASSNPGLSTPFDSSLTQAKTGKITYEARVWLNTYPENLDTLYPPLMGIPGGIEFQIGGDGAVRVEIKNATVGWTNYLATSAVNSVPLNRWANLAVAVDYSVTPRQIYAYIDGQPLALNTDAAFGNYAVVNSPFTVAYSPTPMTLFNGKIDEIRVSNDLPLGAGLPLGNNPVTPSPVLLAGFGFNEGSGDSTYATGNLGLNGRLYSTGGATEPKPGWTAGVIGTALAFTAGTSSPIVQVTSGYQGASGLQRMTVEGWVFPGTPGSEARGILRVGLGYSERSWSIGTTASGNLTLQLHTQGGNDTIVSPAPLAVGRWIHIAGVYTGDSSKLFIDGVHSYSHASTGQPLKLTPLGEGINIGTPPWVGRLDELRIYSGALTDAQILQRYLDTKPPD